MGYTELVEKLRTLTPEKQGEVFDFVEFLSTRYRMPIGEEPALDAREAPNNTTEGFSGPLAALRARVATQYGDLQPMSRDELYDRPCLR